MAKPEDIPQDIWLSASKALGATEACTCDLCVAEIARAIMAERERCAKIAVARSDHKRAHCDDACVCDNGYHVAVEIRRGEAA